MDIHPSNGSLHIGDPISKPDHPAPSPSRNPVATATGGTGYSPFTRKRGHRRDRRTAVRPAVHATFMLNEIIICLRMDNRNVERPMRNCLSRLLIGGVLAAGFGLDSLPAQAGPAVHAGLAPAAISSGSIEITLVRDHHPRWHRHHPHRRHWRHHRRPRSGFFFEFHTRPLYRPAPAPRYALPPAHVQWCYSRYRSYRAYDNTFQPYNGPRRQCRSPYWG